MCENKVACCDVIPQNKFSLPAWITKVQVILTKRFSQLLKVFDTLRHVKMGLERGKNINNLFAEKYDVREVGSINYRHRCAEAHQ